MKKCWLFLKRQMNIQRFILGVIIIAVIAILFVVVMIFTPQISDKLFPKLRESVSTVSMAAMVVATLILAYATFRIITSGRQRENRDREERLLSEIIEWASNVAESAIGRQTIDFSELWKAKLEYKYHKSKGKYIGEIVSSSFKELSDSFKDINNKMDETIRFTEQILGGKGNILALKDYETGIAVSVEKLFEEAAKIKTKDIGQ